MLWIAVHLPLLSLEAWSLTLPPLQQQGPLALTDAHAVVAANAVARAHGVEPGMRRVTAQALSPGLVLGRADPARDAVALQAVAHAALAYTPSVTLAAAGVALPAGRTTPSGRAASATFGASATSAAAPKSLAPAAEHTVLLEVQASLRCFGGRRSLLQRLAASLAPLGHHLRCAGASTPQAADLLARSGAGAPLDGDLPCVPAPHLSAALDRLPAWLLTAGRQHWPAWQDIGVHTLGDLRRLPRAGLAQRYGESVQAEIDRALGHRPDPRAWLVPAPTFADRVELHARAESAEPLLQAATVLLTRLLAWATAHHALIGRCTLRLHHERRLYNHGRHRGLSHSANRSHDGHHGHQGQHGHQRHQGHDGHEDHHGHHDHHGHDDGGDDGADTCLDLALAEPSCDRAHLLLLLRERLARLQLPAATLELSLHCDALVHTAPPNHELFATRSSERLGLLQLIERLQARLGHGEVQRLVPVPDHRPEHDSAMTGLQSFTPATGPSLQTESTAWHMAGRPVWLLPQPQPLAERRSRPVLDGRPLQLLCGPERIESGWWDGLLAERDYFIARSAGGALVWIYRARLPMAPQAGWYLHGRYA